MAAPWEKYQAPTPAPWERYSDPAQAPVNPLRASADAAQAEIAALEASGRALSPQAKAALIDQHRQQHALDPVLPQMNDLNRVDYGAAQNRRNAANPLADFGAGAARTLAGVGPGVVGLVSPETGMRMRHNIDATYGDQAQGLAGYAGTAVGAAGAVIGAMPAGPLGMAGIYGASGAGGTRSDIHERRIAGEQISGATEARAAGSIGALEGLSGLITGGLISKARALLPAAGAAQGGGSALANLIRTEAPALITEMGEEGAVQLLGNLVRQQTYAPEQGAWDGVVESAVMAGPAIAAARGVGRQLAREAAARGEQPKPRKFTEPRSEMRDSVRQAEAEVAEEQALQAEGEAAGILRPEQPRLSAEEKAARDAEADAWARREAEAADPTKPAPRPVSRAAEAEQFPARLEGPEAVQRFFGRYERDADVLASYSDEPMVLVDLPLAAIPVQQLGFTGEVDKGKMARAREGDPATRPPILAAEMGRGHLFVPDGNHRVMAARERGEATIKAYVPESVAARRGLLAARSQAESEIEVEEMVAGGDTPPPRFPDRVSIDRLAEIEAPSADLGADVDAEALAASAQFQKDNINTIDHGGSEFVKVRVPVDQLQNAGTRDVASEPEVADYAQMDPATAPPPAVGPLKGGDGSLVIVDGQRRVAAARARGETEVEVYMPENAARERGFLRPPLPGAVFGPRAGFHGTPTRGVSRLEPRSGTISFTGSRTYAGNYADGAGGSRQQGGDADMLYVDDEGHAWQITERAGGTGSPTKIQYAGRWDGETRTLDPSVPEPVGTDPTTGQPDPLTPAALERAVERWEMGAVNQNAEILERDLSGVAFLDLDSPEGKKALANLPGLSAGARHRIAEGFGWRDTKYGSNIPEVAEILQAVQHAGYGGIKHLDDYTPAGPTYAAFADPAASAARPAVDRATVAKQAEAVVRASRPPVGSRENPRIVKPDRPPVEVEAAEVRAKADAAPTQAGRTKVAIDTLRRVAGKAADPFRAYGADPVFGALENRLIGTRGRDAAAVEVERKRMVEQKRRLKAAKASIQDPVIREAFNAALEGKKSTKLATEMMSKDRAEIDRLGRTYEKMAREVGLSGLADAVAKNRGKYVQEFHRDPTKGAPRFGPKPVRFTEAFNKMKRDAPMLVVKGRMTKYDTAAERDAAYEEAVAKHGKRAVKKLEPISEADRLNDEKFIRNPFYRAAMTKVNMRHDIEAMGVLRDTADAFGQRPPKGLDPKDTEAWASANDLVPLPLKGQLHDLNNVYVPKGVAERLVERYELPSQMEHLYQRYIRLWKDAKTTKNPSTHFANFIGNATFFATLAGTSPMNPANWGHYNKAIHQMREGVNDATYRALMESGSIGSEFSATELAQSVEKLGHDGDPTTLMFKIAKAAKAGDRAAKRLYQAEDVIFKLAKANKELAAGKTMAEVVREVDNSFPNYHRTSKAAKWVRDFPLGAPFISFFDLAGRVVGKAAVRDPQRLATALAVPFVLDTISRAMLGVTDDEDELMGRDGLAYFWKTMTSPLLYNPFGDGTGRDEQGAATALDFRRLIPFLTDVVPTTNNGVLQIPWFAGNPLTGALMEQIFGVDKFTGRPFVRETQTAKEQTQARAARLFNATAPLPTAVTHAPKRIGRAAAGESEETAGAAAIGALAALNWRRDYIPEDDARKVFYRIIDGVVTGDASPDDLVGALTAYNENYRRGNTTELTMDAVFKGYKGRLHSERAAALAEAAIWLRKGDEDKAQTVIDQYEKKRLPHRPAASLDQARVLVGKEAAQGRRY